MSRKGSFMREPWIDIILLVCIGICLLGYPGKWAKAFIDYRNRKKD